MDEYSKEVNDIFENMKVELERMKKDEVSQIEIKEEMDQKSERQLMETIMQDIREQSAKFEEQLDRMEETIFFMQQNSVTIKEELVKLAYDLTMLQVKSSDVDDEESTDKIEPIETDEENNLNNFFNYRINILIVFFRPDKFIL